MDKDFIEQEIEEEKEQKRIDLLKKLSDKCNEISTMKQELRLMERDIKQSYPEFDETIEDDDKPIRRNGQFASQWRFERQLNYHRYFHFIKNHKQKISDLIKEKDECRQLYLDEYGEFLQEPEERIRLQLINKIMDNRKELKSINQTVQYLTKELQDYRDFYKYEYGGGR